MSLSDLQCWPLQRLCNNRLTEENPEERLSVDLTRQIPTVKILLSLALFCYTLFVSYVSIFHFSASIDASSAVAEGPMPPVAAKTKGERVLVTVYYNTHLTSVI